jgi:hypothetical protein
VLLGVARKRSVRVTQLEGGKCPYCLMGLGTAPGSFSAIPVMVALLQWFVSDIHYPNDSHVCIFLWAFVLD